MDAEGAEYSLRRIGEAAVRAVGLLGEPDGYWDVLNDARSRMQQAGAALAALGVLTEAHVTDIEAELELALTLRLPPADDPERAHAIEVEIQRAAHSALARDEIAVSPREPPPAGPEPLVRIAAIGTVVPALDGELYVLAYMRTQASGWFAVASRDLPEHASLTATDDSGARYALTLAEPRYGGFAFASLSSARRLMISPAPPESARWVDLDASGIRIDLAAPGPEPAIAITRRNLTAGEFYLHQLVAAVISGAVASSITELGEALCAAGVLDPASPLPGQLELLYRHRQAEADLTALPPGLPDYWQIAWPLPDREPSDAEPPEDVPPEVWTCAGLAVTLPPLDGLRISLAGLHIEPDSTTLHVHAGGLGEQGLPPVWLRAGDGWHMTFCDVGSYNAGYDDAGQRAVVLTVLPPLPPAPWIQLLVVGQAAEIRATVPLRWAG